jgi:hypothetical protein
MGYAIAITTAPEGSPDDNDGNIARDIVALIANTALDATHRGKIITNTGATQALTHTLPAALGLGGDPIIAMRDANYAVRLDPQGSDVVDTGAAGKYLELTQTNSLIVLTDVVAGKWTVTSGGANWQIEL